MKRTFYTGLAIFFLSLFVFIHSATASPFSIDISNPSTDQAAGSLIGTVTVTVPKGYMLYRSQISANTQDGHVEIQLPKGHRKPDPFGPGEIEIFDDGSWQIGVQLNQIIATPDAHIEFGYQGCSTLTCFMPDTFEFRWPVPFFSRPGSQPAPASISSQTNSAMIGSINEQASLPATGVGSVTTPGGSVDFGRTIQERGLVSAMLLAFFGGLLVSLTPCVYPMIPITLSIIGSRDENRSLARGFALSVLYVAGLSLTYALLGLAVASFGAHLRGVIQGPWFQGVMALIFAILALSMFDLFLLQVPDVLRQRLAGFRSGSTAGVFLTGMVSGLMASPCVAAPLAGILAFIAATGSALFGFMLLLAFAWGMGLILIFLGTFSGIINSLPRAGEWMNRIKEFYGFLLLGAALYFIRPLVGAPWGDLGVSLLLAGFAGFLGLFASPGPETSLGERVRKCMGVVALAVACAFAVSSAARWGGLCFPAAGIDHTGIPRPAPGTESGFPRWHGSIEAALAEARMAGKPVFVDFRADWCPICRELEETVFPHREVAPLLSKYVLLRIDVTRNEGEAAKLLARYRIVGLPTMLLLRSDGTEREDLRIVGDINPADFARVLEKGLR